jgi:ribosomal protein S8
LRSLTEKGFVKEITEDNKKKFGAVHPDKIREYLKQRELEAESIVEKIKKISSNLSDNDEISLTRGCFAARQALLDLLKIRQEIKGYGFPKDAVFVLGEGFIDEFHRIREKEKIKMSLIVNDDVKKRMGLKNLKKSNVKYFPAEYSSKVSTFTCGDQVVKIVFGSPPCTVITTKGKEISNDNEFIFDFAWKYIDSGDKKLN